MTHLKPTTILIGAGVLMFIAAFVWPTFALFIHAINAPADGPVDFTLSARQGLLLVRTLGLSTAATITTLFFSIPAAAWIGLRRGRSCPVILSAIMLTILVCPPMVYVFGWQRILPPNLNPYIQCILYWSLWAWPIPAMIMGLSWAKSVHPAYEAALLETTTLQAWRNVAWPALRIPLLTSGLILFILFIGDYGVPHACGLIVWSTELLAICSAASRPIQVLAPALPLSILCLIFACILIFRCHKATLALDSPATKHTGVTSWAPPIVTLSLCTTSILIPVLGLVFHLHGASEFANMFRTYWPDILATLMTAALAALLATFLGLIACTLQSSKWIAMSWMILFAAIPAPIIGVAMIYAYNHDATDWVYDSAAIIVLAYVAKFGWVPVLTCRAALSRIDPDTLEQAALDGASRSATIWHIVQPVIGPTLACSAWVFITLAISDVAATSLVRGPSFTPIAHILIEKFHRLEDQMLISLSLTLIAIAAIPAVFLNLALKRQR